DVGVGHTMAAAPLGVVDVVAQPANLGQAGQGQQEVAGPGVVDPHIAQGREGTCQFGPYQGLDIGRIAGAIDHTAAEDQPAVSGQAIVIQQVVAILDAVIL